MSGKTKGVWPLWNLPALEGDGAEEVPAKLGAFSCPLRGAEAPTWVRFGACESKTAAGKLEYRMKWQKCGWEPLCERGALIAFGADSDAELPEDDGLRRLFDKAIRRRENARIVTFVLAALCMIVGYAMQGFTVVRLAAIPLIAALLLSLSISKLQKAQEQMDRG